MAHVDALSRAPNDNESADMSVEAELSSRLEVFIALSTTDRVRLMQQADERTRKVIKLLESPNERTRGEEAEVSHYELSDGVLYRMFRGRPLLVVPKSMRKGVVMSAHDYGGHFSVDRTISRITKDYWFSCMRRYVRQHIKMCIDCLTHQRPAGKQAGLLHPTPPGRRPFQIIHIDHLGPFETSRSKNRYLLVIADNLTKYVQLYPCRTTDTAGVLRILGRFVDERGLPDRIISDRGTCFTSHAFERFCKLNSISHVLNSTRHPQANGQVERANRTILPLLSLTAADQSTWDARIRDVERHLNSAENKTTSKTPYEALYGYQPRYQGGVLHSLSRTKNDRVEPAEQHAEVRDSIVQGQVQMKRRYDQRHHDRLRFEAGEVVVMLRQPVPGQSTKLQSKYRERPLQVIEVLPSDTYRVAELTLEGKTVYSTTAHASQLKSWKVLSEEDPDSDSPSHEETSEEDSDPTPGGPIQRDDPEDIPGDPSPSKRIRKPPARYKDYVMN